jgi:cobaltochelatase CobS
MTDSISSALETLLGSVEERTTAKINETVENEMSFLKKAVDKGKTLNVKIGDKLTKLEGARHKQFEKLLTICAQGLPTLMVGPAGTGKTHAGAQVAEALERSFYAMSVGAQTSKADIMGYMSASGNYVTTAFRTAYEEGGIFLMDEIDAGNANVLIQVNSALSNGLCQFPDKMVKRHKDFIFIASANTYGDGASRQYVGRNQLDAATLDRFVFLNWELDENLEEIMAGGSADGKKWLNVVRTLREWAGKNAERVIVSPRAVERGVKLLAAGIPYTQVVEHALLGSFPKDKQKQALSTARNAWSAS